jgi:hypothetical protein
MLLVLKTFRIVKKLRLKILNASKTLNISMIKKLFSRKASGKIAVMCCIFVLPGFQSASKQSGTIVLHDEKLPITPKEYYIADVTDDREDRSAVAWLLPDASAKEPSKVDLQGGGLVAVKQFINHNLPHNNILRPVVISLKKFMVTETMQGNGGIEGKISLGMSFGLLQDDTTKHLVDYNGSIKYTRAPGPAQDVEPMLRQSLGKGLGYFDAWMNQQAGSNIKLAKAVEVTFIDYQDKTEDDTVYYATNRPLTWSDFKGKIPQSRFAAEVYPVIGYDEQVGVEQGVIKVMIGVKVSLPKSAAWAREDSRSDYTLNHEQRHFDIAKIAAEQFKQKLRAEHLPVTNYDGYINSDYLDAYREMDDMQKQYDDETSHGTDHAAQERWNEKIDLQLKYFRVKK